MHLGNAAEGLRASTFHAWCITLMRRAPAAFGCKGYSVIDRDDQLQLFRVLRGKNSASRLLSAQQLCDLYSFARNTVQTLDTTLTKISPEKYGQKDQIAQVMLAYEKRKKERRYLDYDDILDVVAQRLQTSTEACSWVAEQYDHMLVDEMQDTNPLQWKLIAPLMDSVTLFCVGDDAQSIYGFRGADFRNVHHFSTRVDNAVTLKLEENYRSTQEILDVSNWLLFESPLKYEKSLIAVRGDGMRPQLHTFANEWAEARWVTDDLLERRANGAEWRNHMILARSGFAARIVESALLSREIPYKFIGGTKLLESAHIRDVLSVLRVVANPQDEIAWMRFLMLWNGVGEVTANDLVEKILSQDSLDGCVQVMETDHRLPKAVVEIVLLVKAFQNEVSEALSKATGAMEELLAAKYRNQNWDKRQRDFRLVQKLADRHSSILAFIEEYILEPVHGSEVARDVIDDAVTVITVHSAKGSECEVCYVINVSPGAYPSSYAQSNEDDTEEERRVLYVALTRAKDQLIVTRQGYRLWAEPDNATTAKPDVPNVSPYFFNNLPVGLFDEHVHKQDNKWSSSASAPELTEPVSMGIIIG